MLLEEDEEDIQKERVPHNISVLTTEYFVRGLDDMDYSAFEAANDSLIGDNEGTGFTLDNAEVQPMGLFQPPPRKFVNWHVPSMNNIIAILAEDPSAEEALLDFWVDFNMPFKVVIYTGAYIVEGTMFSDEADTLEFYRQAFRPIQDAIITCVSNNKAEPILVKLGLVNVSQIHGYAIDPG
jgi:hypothetical protein